MTTAYFCSLAGWGKRYLADDGELGERLIVPVSVDPARVLLQVLHPLTKSPVTVDSMHLKVEWDNGSIVYYDLTPFGAWTFAIPSAAKTAAVSGFVTIGTNKYGFYPFLLVIV